MTPEEKKERQRLRAREWRLKNPDAARAAAKRYHASDKGKKTAQAYYVHNIEKMREKSKLWGRKFRKERPEEARAAEKKWRDANPEKAREIRRQVLRAWRKKNPEKTRAAARRQRAANPEKRREAEKRWRAANISKTQAKFMRRRALVVGARGESTAEQIEARVSVFGGCCVYCHGPYETIDHVIPLARGGSNWPANLRPACLQCNSSKGSKLLSEWHGPPIGGWPKRIAA